MRSNGRAGNFHPARNAEEAEGIGRRAWSHGGIIHLANEPKHNIP